MTASTLDVRIEGEGITMTGVKPSDTQERTIEIVSDGNEDFTYTLQTVITKTSPLCDAITFVVKRGTTEVYSGSISGFTEGPFVHSAGSNAWTMSAKLNADDESLMHSSCTFSLRSHAKQVGGSGLSDTEQILNSVATNTWVVVSFEKNSAEHTVSFTVRNIDEYTLLEYTITYSSDGGDRGIVGSEVLSSDPSYEKTGIFLGSCTSGGTCTPDTGVTELKLTVELTDDAGHIHTFEKAP